MPDIDFNLPTNLTILRIALIPLLIIFFYAPWAWTNLVCTIIFIIASITDWLDGYLARKMKNETCFGAFLDPVADKLMVAMILVLLVQREPTALMAVPVAIIIGREITIASLREWMALTGQSKKVEVADIGKWKTTFQMISIGCLLYKNDLIGLPVFQIGYVLLYLSTVLTLWSMIMYLKAAFSEPSIKLN